MPNAAEDQSIEDLLEEFHLQAEAEKLVEELEEDDGVVLPMTEADIVRKYDEGQARIIIQRNDFLVPNILQMVENKAILDVTPQYQRRSRWTNRKRSQLIESLLMNIPIPPIFLYERDYARYEVMDGQQRLTSIRAFFKNEFRLSDLTIWKELNNRTFRDLPLRIQAGLERRSLAAVIVLTESGATPEAAMQLRQYVFERLNTGGQPLNAQEVRNCIYASSFNALLFTISRSELFTTAWDIPPKEPGEPQHISRKLENNRLYSSMYDCEIVLRYFALSEMDQFTGGMKSALDRYMARMMKATKVECAALGREYLQALKIAQDIYGEMLFRLPDEEGKLRGRRSVPFSDAVLMAIREHRSSAEALIQRRQQIIAATERLRDNPDTYETLVGRANTRDAIVARLDIAKKIMAEALA